MRCTRASFLATTTRQLNSNTEYAASLIPLARQAVCENDGARWPCQLTQCMSDHA